MKKIKFIGAAVGCLLAGALNCFAFKQEAPPSPVEETPGISAKHSDYSVTLDTGTFDNVFVGHYGEVFHFNDHYAVEPVMQDLTEVIRFHERNVKSKKGVYEPFEPKAGDYIPRNFTPMHLGQLIVIPKNAPNGFQSLTKLREAKEKELASSGVGYEIQSFSFDRDYWPDDTFGVLISTPYQLYQLYSQSDKNIFIMTSGIFTPEYPTNGDLRGTYDSLQKYLAQFNRQVAEDYLIYRNPYIAVPWIVILVISGALGLFPKRSDWRGRLRLIGRATLVFSAILPLIGVAVILLGQCHGLQKWVNMGSAGLFIGALLPCMCVALSACLGGRRLWRVFLWTAGINILPAIVTFSSAYSYFYGITSDDRAEYFGAYLILIIMGLLSGICFGLTHDDAESEVVPEMPSL